jgi:mercuric ion transport protein
MANGIASIGRSVPDGERRARPVRSNAFALGGAAGGLGAILGSSCCVVPLALAGLGAGAGLTGALGFLAAVKIPVLIAAVLMLGIAWWSWLRQRVRVRCEQAACAAQARSSRSAIVLILGTTLVLLAAAWAPLIEPVLAGLTGAG